MPIDETALDNAIKDIVTKLNDNRVERRILDTLYKNITSIALKTVSDATPEDPRKTKLVLPDDSEIGDTITEERRQTIYDKVMVDMTNS